ncbi:MAG TPA: DUF6801 domain-containing protein [Pseudonocardiaceae bacterium]|nr:DUF6801 domain-containing protein [Pseudonocardiaceae bacterium]
MTMSLRSKPLLRGVAAVAAAGAVAGAVVLAGAGSASAATDTLALDYGCEFPVLIQAQMLHTVINVNLPQSIAVGTSTGPINVSAAVTVPGSATAGLNLVSAASIAGTAIAPATLVEPNGSSLQLQVNLTVPSTPVPQDGSSFTVNATGQLPPIQFGQSGTATVSVGNTMSTTLEPKQSDGTDTGIGQFTSDCTLAAGQNTQLASIAVGTGGGSSTSTTSGTSTSPTSSTTSTSPTSSTTSTTSSTTSTTSSTTTTTSPSSSTTTTSPSSSTTGTTSTTASSSGGGSLHLNYAVNGTSHLQSLGSDIPVGPGTLGVDVNLASGALSGPLTLPNNTTSFNLFGFVPGTATVALIPQGPVTGTFQQGVVNADVKETIRLVDVSIYGVPIVSNSTTCQTTSPSDIQLKSGSDFSIANGGTLAGTYSIAGLANNGCGFLTSFISAFTQSTGNTLSVKVTPTTS